MLAKKITYKDFDGKQHTETLHFNLNQLELVTLSSKYGGNIERYMDKANEADSIIAAQDMIDRAYGEKSEDGKHFRKSEEILNDFRQSAVYETFYKKLFTDEKEMAKFVKGLFKMSPEENKAYDEAIAQHKKDNQNEE